ncbi:MAG: hypothetical protein WCK03_04220, partial [Candidatus Taylorbacteria bacterium]
ALIRSISNLLARNSMLERVMKSRLIRNKGEQNSRMTVLVLFSSSSSLNHKKKAKNPNTNPVYRVIELLKG